MRGARAPGREGDGDGRGAEGEGRVFFVVFVGGRVGGEGPEDESCGLHGECGWERGHVLYVLASDKNEWMAPRVLATGRRGRSERDWALGDQHIL